MKILVATEKPFAPVAVKGIKEVVEAAGHELVLVEKGTKADMLAAVVDAAGLIVRSDKVDKEVFDAAKELKVVVRAGAGYDNCTRCVRDEHSWPECQRCCRVGYGHGSYPHTQPLQWYIGHRVAR